ncbi:hypothetical protein JCGZ_00206 [Jatropha curcas]|uniref:TF-B3 domain-containing protein n=1 Tax=Jatropha curcas TaxID=180498 RepID=A0A067LE91_JATCU|nr:hypothetical protein JCGZ_00206 [Jatropha curcas]
MANLKFFSKTLTKIDIERKLSVLLSSTGQLPFEEGQMMTLTVYDDSGCRWIFPCSIEEDGGSGRFLTLGWLEFVNKKNLRVGDKLIIHEEFMNNNSKGQANPRTWNRIYVQRKIRLFGVDIWGNL